MPSCRSSSSHRAAGSCPKSSEPAALRLEREPPGAILSNIPDLTGKTKGGSMGFHDNLTINNMFDYEIIMI